MKERYFTKGDSGEEANQVDVSYPLSDFITQSSYESCQLQNCAIHSNVENESACNSENLSEDPDEYITLKTYGSGAET
jgi:hypothetical protein